MNTQTHRPRTPEVEAVDTIRMRGNIIHNSWYRHLRMPNGLLDMASLLILAELVYWYRSYEVREEAGGKLLHRQRKFYGDLWHISYQQLADRFGFSKRQVSDAVERLEKLHRVVERVFRTVTITIPNSNGVQRTLNNVLFLKPILPRILEISADEPENPPPAEDDVGDEKNLMISISDTPVALQRHTPMAPQRHSPRRQNARQSTKSPVAKTPTSAEKKKNTVTSTSAGRQIFSHPPTGDAASGNRANPPPPPVGNEAVRKKEGPPPRPSPLVSPPVPPPLPPPVRRAPTVHSSHKLYSFQDWQRDDALPVPLGGLLSSVTEALRRNPGISRDTVELALRRREALALKEAS